MELIVTIKNLGSLERRLVDVSHQNLQNMMFLVNEYL